MQLHGSLFSTLDAAVSAINEDSELQKRLMMMFFAEEAIAGEPVNSNWKTLVDKFPEQVWKPAYAEYRRIREDLKQLSDPSNLGHYNTLDEAISSCISKWEEVIGNSDAKWCVVLASRWLNHALDPKIVTTFGATFRSSLSWKELTVTSTTR